MDTQQTSAVTLRPERPVGMEDLPVELKIAVIRSVDDPKSLLNLALTNKAFYSLVKRDEAGLSANICFRRIGANLARLALATARSEDLAKAPSKEWTVERMKRFINTYFTLGVVPMSPQSMTFSLCHQLLAFHELVRHYAAVVAAQAIANIPSDDAAARGRCSTLETHRFQKALYLLALSENLLRCSKRMSRKSISLRPAWGSLWRKFAPWELQQARCAKYLLEARVNNIMSPETTGGVPSLWADTKWVRVSLSFTGLAKLKALEDAARPGGMREAFREYQAAVGAPSPDLELMTGSWFDTHDKLWLKRLSFGQLSNIRQDTMALLRKYSEADPGPQDAWLYTFLQNHTGERLLGKGKATVFQCYFHAPGWGFSFWDRQRMDRIGGETLPTTEEMLGSSNIWIDRRNLGAQFLLHFDPNSCRANSCTCGSVRMAELYA